MSRFAGSGPADIWAWIGRRKEMRRTVGVLLAVVVMVVPLSVASAEERRVEGGFTASAPPLPLAWPLPASACSSETPDVSTVTERITAPFSGWLNVKATFSGDWDLQLFGAEGERLAMSEYQINWAAEMEAIRYFVPRGTSVEIRVCNIASSSDAEVKWTLQGGRAWAAPAGKKRITRTELLSYVVPGAAINGVHVICHAGYQVGCAGTGAIRPTDRYVSIEIDDEAGTAVSGEFFQYIEDSQTKIVNFCTATEEPIALVPGATYVGVSFLDGPCADGTPAQATRGKATLTFSNKK
jgi:hypothetical protein